MCCLYITPWVLIAVFSGALSDSHNEGVETVCPKTHWEHIGTELEIFSSTDVVLFIYYRLQNHPNFKTHLTSTTY